MDVDIVGVAVGGDGLGRIADGRVIFVSGALPGEKVRVRITQEKKSLLRGAIVEVLEASPDRQVPWCPHVADGCGGCGWQHVSPGAQLRLKREMVLDSLRRTAKVDSADADRLVRLGPDLPDRGVRTTLRAAVGQGVLGMRAYHTNEVVPITSCGVAHELLDQMLWNMSVPSRGDELEVRVGVASGEHTVRVITSDDEAPQRTQSETQDAFVVHETVAGSSFRVSAPSFFQTSLVGAEALVKLVDAAAGTASKGQTLIDLYGGVGLFAGTVGKRFDAVVVVEISSSSCSDARYNLARHRDAQIVQRDVVRWRLAKPLGVGPVIVADPARKGLDRGGVDTIVACRPSRVVLVSCDIGSYGRDTKLLIDAGFRLEDAVCVDIFPNTPHVEVVSTFVPSADVSPTK
jgi:23S rRNA (uracil1939-C5)-methyltransferase